MWQKSMWHSGKLVQADRLQQEWSLDAWPLNSGLSISRSSAPGMLVWGFSPHSPIPQSWASCAFSPTGFTSEFISLSVEHALSQLPQYPISPEIKMRKEGGACTQKLSCSCKIDSFLLCPIGEKNSTPKHGTKRILTLPAVFLFFKS